MPYANVDKRRQYVRNYKQQHRDKLNTRRRLLYAQEHPSKELTNVEKMAKIEAAKIAKASCDRRYRIKHKIKVVKLKRAYALKTHYNVTEEIFANFWKRQDGRCAICSISFNKQWPSRKYDSACVDHNHVTGEIRGLLCRRCNLALGLFKDDPETLLKATTYISK